MQIEDNRGKQVQIEIFNTLIHFTGVVLGVVFLVMMIRKSLQVNSRYLPGFVIYGAFFIAMFLTSSMYHGTLNKKVKSMFRIFDHTTIFLFIAGSYTPIIMVFFSAGQRITLMVGIWVMAILGTIFKVATKGSYDKFKKMSVFLYIAMGWLSIFMVKPIFARQSYMFAVLLVIGGLLYTVGTIFYNMKRSYSHVVWHFFVLFAAITHFVGYYLFLI